nr:hypothetical protein [Tanacetum cinerariifolium]
MAVHEVDKIEWRVSRAVKSFAVSTVWTHMSKMAGCTSLHLNVYDMVRSIIPSAKRQHRIVLLLNLSWLLLPISFGKKGMKGFSTITSGRWLSSFETLEDLGGIEGHVFQSLEVQALLEILVYHFTLFFAMSTQQDIYAAGSENRPSMLNKENYVPWSSRLLQYAKSRPNGKLIHNSIINGPYVRRMIPEPGDPNREVHVNETFHVQTDDELTEKKLKQIAADDQAIQTILLGLPQDIYAAVV